jgi:hypothetical protein
VIGLSSLGPPGARLPAPHTSFSRSKLKQRILSSLDKHLTTDPLSLTASAIALLQISGAIINALYDYRSRSKNAAKDASRIINELNSLRTGIDAIFLLLEAGGEEKTSRGSALGKLAEAGGPLERREVCLNNLAQKLGPKDGWKAARVAIFRPLKEQEMIKILQDLNSTKTTTQLALAADQM